MDRRCEQCGKSYAGAPPERPVTCPHCGHSPGDARSAPAILDPDLFDLSGAPPSPPPPVPDACPARQRWSDEDFATGPPPETVPEPDAADVAKTTASPDLQERRHPWYFDIWLYPFHRHSLAMGLVLVGLPLLISLIAYLSYALLIALTFLLPFAVGIMGLAVIALLVIDLYLIWYICTCVRDSAEGNMRAPDTLGRSPDHLELTGQTLLLVFGSLLFWLPVMLCFSYVPWPWLRVTVLVLTGAFFPLALLRAIMEESLSGFNPLPLPGMIWRTGRDYALLALATGALAVLPAWALYIWSEALSRAWWVRFMLNPLFLPLLYYPLLVLAHLWGRFYDRHGEWLG
jgi:hypothetical protein